jgi:hypothetical protein
VCAGIARIHLSRYLYGLTHIRLADLDGGATVAETNCEEGCQADRLREEEEAGSSKGKRHCDVGMDSSSAAAAAATTTAGDDEGEDEHDGGGDEGEDDEEDEEEEEEDEESEDEDEDEDGDEESEPGEVFQSSSKKRSASEKVRRMTRTPPRISGSVAVDESSIY